MIEWIVRAAVERRVAVVVVTAVLAVAALLFDARLRFDALPDVTGHQVLVLTRAPGLTPEEVERLVTRPIETAAGGLPGIVGQRSVSRYGLSAVTLLFDDGTDLFRARQVVSERLASVAGNLPPSAEVPELGPLTGGLGEIYHFTLSSSRRTPAELLEIAQFRIAPLLRSVPGVVEVNTWGGARRTLDVVGDPIAMARQQVTLSELSTVVTRAVGSAPGASLPAGPAHALLRGMALPLEPSDLSAAIVRADPVAGRALRIGDVADVRVGLEPRIGASTASGRGETVYVMVQMLIGDNALEVLARVHDRLPDVHAALPEDVVMTEVYDRSHLVHATLQTVGRSLLEGGLLVVLVLFAMLGSFRAGALVASVIPLSMLGAVALMVLFDVPGNLMSLGALDFGLLVDGAVVVIETVFHQFHVEHDQRDRPNHQRVSEIAQSVARPVFFSVLVILLVYVPVLALTGVEGKMFRPMALTVVFALAVALVLTLTYVPAAAALALRPVHVPAKEPLLVRIFTRGYEPILVGALRHPFVVVVVAIGALVAGGVVFWRSGSAFVPQLDEGDLVVQTTRGADIGIEAAIAEAGRLETAIETVPEVARVVSRVGSPAVATDVMGIEQADVFVALRPRDTWRAGLDHEGVIEEIQRAIDAHAPGAELAFTQPIQMRFNELVGGAVTDVSLSVFGDDLDELRRIAEQAAGRLRDVEGAVDVRIVSPPAVMLVEVRPQYLAASQAGFDAGDVLDVVRAVRTGVPAATTWDGPVRIPIRVRLGEVPTAFTIDDVLVPTGGGSAVPLSRIATVAHLEALALVSHEDGARRIVVGFNVRGRDLGSVVQDAEASIASVERPRGYRLVWGGQYEGLERARARLAIVIPVVLVSILVLLYRLFGSLRPTLIIFLNVPFAAVGGVLAIAARAMPISISAAIGFIALSGIAVLNGVVLVSRIREEEAAGRSAREAAERAARSRVRPVLMTALVASFGFVPMMLAHGVGAEVQRPLATVVVGGLVTSTLLTLVVLPTIYPWLAGKRAAPLAPPPPPAST